MKKNILLILGLSLSLSLFAKINKTINVSTAGTLYTLLSENEIDSISNLTVTGTIDARDFVIIRDSLKKLDSLDLSSATIEEYIGADGTDSDFDTYLANEIPYSAFLYRKKLKSIILPATTSALNEYAFNHCDSLISIKIPSTVTTIGQGTFGHCYALDTILIPNSVKSIGKYAFYYCGIRYASLSSSMTHVGEAAFENSENLNTVIIPSSIKVIDANAFSNCYKLKTINIPSSVDSILESAFYDCLDLRTVSIPSTVKYIGESAFSNCRSLQTFEIPTSMTKIPSYLFYLCDSIKSVTIPTNIKSIGYKAFSYCENLQSLNIPSTIDSIGGYAFNSCISLKSITIPTSVTFIDEYAFYSCDSLLSINIPNSVKKIGEGAFSLCSQLKTVTLPSTLNIIKYKTFYECEKLETINIPSTVDTIEESAFKACYSLKTLQLPISLKFIDQYAFYDCTGLQSINIPNSIDSIGEDAFQNVSLKKLIAFTGPNIIDYDKLPVDSLFIPQGTSNAYIASNHYDYKVIKEFEACVASANLITIPGQGIFPLISFKSDTVICPGQTATLKSPTASTYLWSTNETTQNITVSTTGTYSLTAVNTNGCMSTAKEKVIIHQPFADEIKIATFNKKSDAIIIAWTPTKGKQIASYALQLLDDATGKYKTIAKHGIADSTFFADNKANGLIQTYSYRLISYDSICYDSAISKVHETIHLSCSQNPTSLNVVELGWNTYKGLTPAVYKVYVNNGGSVVDSFTLANNGNSTFSRSYAKHKQGYTYRIGFDLDNKVYTGTLKSDSGPFSQSLSNLAESELTESEALTESTISIYPNPANTCFWLTSKENTTVSLYSMTGQLLLTKNVLVNESISTIAFPAGIYFIKIQTGDSVVTHSLIIDKK